MFLLHLLQNACFPGDAQHSCVPHTRNIKTCYINEKTAICRPSFHFRLMTVVCLPYYIHCSVLYGYAITCGNGIDISAGCQVADVYSIITRKLFAGYCLAAHSE